MFLRPNVCENFETNSKCFLEFQNYSIRSFWNWTSTQNVITYWKLITLQLKKMYQYPSLSRFVAFPENRNQHKIYREHFQELFYLWIVSKAKHFQRFFEKLAYKLF